MQSILQQLLQKKPFLPHAGKFRAEIAGGYTLMGFVHPPEATPFYRLFAGRRIS